MRLLIKELHCQYVKFYEVSEIPYSNSKIFDLSLWWLVNIRFGEYFFTWITYPAQY
ncbi:hypothetical protein GL2_34890 [Microbulbifer sp. GL-2]|nr:hypothetical protein GL2_34890 [Microbulbifer sp. GL-2]